MPFGAFLIAFIMIFASAKAIYVAEAGDLHIPTNEVHTHQEKPADYGYLWEPALVFAETKHLEYAVITGTHEVYVEFNIVRVMDQILVVDSLSRTKRKSDYNTGSRINWGEASIKLEKFAVNKKTLEPLTANYNSAIWNLHYGTYALGLRSKTQEDLSALGIHKIKRANGLDIDFTRERPFHIFNFEAEDNRKIMLWVDKETLVVLKYVEYTPQGELIMESTLTKYS